MTNGGRTGFLRPSLRRGWKDELFVLPVSQARLLIGSEWFTYRSRWRIIRITPFHYNSSIFQEARHQSGIVCQFCWWSAEEEVKWFFPSSFAPEKSLFSRVRFGSLVLRQPADPPHPARRNLVLTNGIPLLPLISRFSPCMDLIMIHIS